VARRLGNRDKTALWEVPIRELVLVTHCIYCLLSVFSDNSDKDEHELGVFESRMLRRYLD
jgi:hypothetical protein